MGELVGRQRGLKAWVEELPRIAAAPVNVLVIGETGTGKELYARALHGASGRSSGPFVPVNCGALPPTIADNELFGHEAGAYTHAADKQPGLVEFASNGTLFLDEVDALSTHIQVKLLRFLQDGEYRRLGSPQAERSNARVVAASNQPRAVLESGRSFRRDLYFRLSTVIVELPPLRERRDDIADLIDHFLSKYAPRRVELTPRAMALAMEYDWPGNVRELEQAIRRALIWCDGQEIDVEHLALRGARDASYPSFAEAKARIVEDFERGYIDRTLRLCSGNVSRAATMAQKHRRAFFELMRKHHINADEYRT